MIVEAYDTREEAIEGHERWVQTMMAEMLPETLTDIANSHIAAEFIGPETHQRKLDQQE